MCTAVLIGSETLQLPPPHLGLYTRALLVSQVRRHLFVTPWSSDSDNFGKLPDTTSIRICFYLPLWSTAYFSPGISGVNLERVFFWGGGGGGRGERGGVKKKKAKILF